MMLNFSSISRLVKSASLVFFLTLLVCSSLLTAVCLIPDERIDLSITTSSEQLSKEGVYPHVLGSSRAYRVDNWTEAAYLTMIYLGDNESPLRSAFGQKSYWKGDNPVQALEALTHGDVSNGLYYMRSQYWLGSRVLTIPLLSFMSYHDTRVVLQLSTMAIIICTAYYLLIYLGRHVSIAYLLSLFSINFIIPGSIWTNGFACIWIASLASIYLLKKDIRSSCLLFFLFLGQITAFLDWFSFPLVTFALPALISLLSLAQLNVSFFERFSFVLKSAIGWCVGYVLMLLSKVAIACLVVGDDAINQFSARVAHNVASSKGGLSVISRIEEIWLTISRAVDCLLPFNVIPQSMFYILFGCVFLLVLRYARKNSNLLLYFLFSLMPLAWFVVFNGYCRIHYWIAYRSFGITILVFILILVTSHPFIIQDVRSVLSKIKEK